MTKRLKITPADIAQLQICSEGYARRIVREMKAYYGKTKKQFITLPEYAAYYAIDVLNVYDSLGMEPSKFLLKEKTK